MQACRFCVLLKNASTLGGAASVWDVIHGTRTPVSSAKRAMTNNHFDITAQDTTKACRMTTFFTNPRLILLKEQTEPLLFDQVYTAGATLNPQCAAVRSFELAYKRR
jgi:hypothetical protein